MKGLYLYNTAHPMAESGKPIFIPFGEWVSNLPYNLVYGDKPDRVLPTRDPNRSQLELDTFDGWSIVMVVDSRNGIKSIQKRKSPGGSTI